MARPSPSHHVTVTARCRRSSERRADCDKWIGQLGEPVDGGVVTWERLETLVLPVLLGSDHVPSRTSLKRHRAKHCRVLDDEAAAEVVAEAAAADDADTEVLLAQVDALLGDGFVSPTGLLDVQLRAYLFDLAPADRQR